MFWDVVMKENGIYYHNNPFFRDTSKIKDVARKYKINASFNRETILNKAYNWEFS